MRALVTGSTGFIGRHLVQALVNHDWEVCCLVRRPIAIRHSSVKQIAGDLLTPSAWRLDSSSQGKIDAVFHCAAALPIDGGITSQQFLAANGGATLALIDTCTEVGIERFVYLSSISVIGIPLYSPIDETHPLAPGSPYALGKAVGELACGMANRRGMKTTTLRLSSPYGAGMNERTVLPTFLRRARQGEALTWYGSGTRSQDFIHVEDVVDVCVRAGTEDVVGLFCLGSGQATSMKFLAEQIAQFVPGCSAKASGSPDPQEGISWQLDVSALEQTIGFRPRVSLMKGLEQMLAGEPTLKVNWIG